VYQLDPIIEKVVTSLRKLGQELLETQRRKAEEDKKKGVFGLFKRAGSGTGGASVSQSAHGGASPPPLSKNTNSNNRLQHNSSSQNPLTKIGSKSSSKKSEESKQQSSSKYSHLSGAFKKAPVLKLAEIDTTKVGISTIDDLEELRFLMRSEVGTVFNTNILRIALNFQEEKIAR
jgi:hypothetical protein